VGTITCSRGAYRAFWSDQGLVNTGVSKTAFYGMEEVVGSIPTRSTSLHKISFSSKVLLLPSTAFVSKARILPAE